jgi:hypothetical protein
MSNPAPDNRDLRRDQREEATIDHLTDRVFEPESREKPHQPPTTDSGASVEEQVRTEWDPKSGVGLPLF